MSKVKKYYPPRTFDPAFEYHSGASDIRHFFAEQERLTNQLIETAASTTAVEFFAAMLTDKLISKIRVLEKYRHQIKMRLRESLEILAVEAKVAKMNKGNDIPKY